MPIQNALASIAVADIEQSGLWYAQLIGEPGRRPMPEVVEWSFPRGGALQVYRAPDRAGKGSLTLAVSDIEEQVRALDAMGVDTSQRSDSDRVLTVMVKDPDGNSIAFAQALDDSLAR